MHRPGGCRDPGRPPDQDLCVEDTIRFIEVRAAGNKISHDDVDPQQRTCPAPTVLRPWCHNTGGNNAHHLHATSPPHPGCEATLHLANNRSPDPRQHNHQDRAPTAASAGMASKRSVGFIARHLHIMWQAAPHSLSMLAANGTRVRPLRTGSRNVRRYPSPPNMAEWQGATAALPRNPWLPSESPGPMATPCPESPDTSPPRQSRTQAAWPARTSCPTDLIPVNLTMKSSSGNNLPLLRIEIPSGKETLLARDI